MQTIIQFRTSSLCMETQHSIPSSEVRCILTQLSTSKLNSLKINFAFLAYITGHTTDYTLPPFLFSSIQALRSMQFPHSLWRYKLDFIHSIPSHQLIQHFGDGSSGFCMSLPLAEFTAHLTEQNQSPSSPCGYSLAQLCYFQHPITQNLYDDKCMGICGPRPTLPFKEMQTHLSAAMFSKGTHLFLQNWSRIHRHWSSVNPRGHLSKESGDCSLLQ